LVLHLLVETDLLLDVGKDLVYVGLESILIVRFFDKCLGKHAGAALLVLVSQLIELEPSHRLDEVINPKEILLIEVVFVVTFECTVFCNESTQLFIQPFFQHLLLIVL
jgi:aryl carrier-like protein